MRVEIEVKDKNLDNVIIQCFKKRNMKHDKNLIFVSSGHKDDFSNMFMAMFQLIKDDDIFPYMKVNFDVSLKLETKGSLNDTVQKEEDMRNEKAN